jgi:hypothetical protein
VQAVVCFYFPIACLDTQGHNNIYRQNEGFDDLAPKRTKCWRQRTACKLTSSTLTWVPHRPDSLRDTLRACLGAGSYKKKKNRRILGQCLKMMRRLVPGFTSSFSPPAHDMHLSFPYHLPIHLVHAQLYSTTAPPP